MSKVFGIIVTLLGLILLCLVGYLPHLGIEIMVLGTAVFGMGIYLCMLPPKRLDPIEVKFYSSLLKSMGKKYGVIDLENRRLVSTQRDDLHQWMMGNKWTRKRYCMVVVYPHYDIFYRD